MAFQRNAQILGSRLKVQHDLDEFLWRFLIDYLEKLDTSSRLARSIDALFAFEEVSHVFDPEHPQVFSDGFSKLRDLRLTLFGTKCQSVVECIREYQAPENVESNIDGKTENGKNIAALRTRRIVKAPIILMVKIDRIRASARGNAVKDRHRLVQFDQELDMSEFTRDADADADGDGDGPSLLYDLAMVQVHDGRFASRGHYICYVNHGLEMIASPSSSKDSQRLWSRVSDTEIDSVSWNTVSRTYKGNEVAVGLVYVRRDMRHNVLLGPSPPPSTHSTKKHKSTQ